MMNDEQFGKIGAWIKRHMPRGCGVCGSKEVDCGDIVETQVHGVPGKCHGYAAIMCTGCGHTVFVSVRAAGIL